MTKKTLREKGRICDENMQLTLSIFRCLSTSTPLLTTCASQSAAISFPSAEFMKDRARYPISCTCTDPPYEI